MVNVSLIQNKFKFILMQLQNDALADGKISSDEKKILSNFRDIVKDLPEIIETMAETSELHPDSDDKEDIIKILDEVFQFILSHLLDEAKKSGDIKQDQFELLETISKKLEDYLDQYISTGNLN